MKASYYRLWFIAAKRWYVFHDKMVNSDLSNELASSPVNFANPASAMEEFNVYKQSIKNLALIVPQVALEYWSEMKDGSQNLIWREILE